MDSKHQLLQQRYLVGYPDLEPYMVTVNLADQLKAEIAAPGFGITRDMGVHFALVTIWAASVRQGTVVAEFDVFRRQIIDFQPAGTVVVDPTNRAALIGSPSPSPASTPAPPSTTGSTPTSD